MVSAQRYNEAQKGNPDAMFEVGKSFQEQRFFEPAIEWLTKASKYGHKDAILHLCDLYVNQGRLNDAAALIEQAINANTDFSMQIAGNYYFKKGDYEKAERYLKQSIEMSSDRNLINESLTILGELIEEKGDLRKAVTWYSRASKQGDFTATKRYIKALENLDLDEELDKVLEIQLRSLTIGEIKELILLFGELRDEKRQLRCLEKAKNMGDPESFSDLALYHFSKGNNEKAIELLEEALRLGLVEVKVNLGVIHIESGNVERGMKLLEEAAEEGISEAKYNLGLYLMEDSPFTALKWLEEAYDDGLEEAKPIATKIREMLEQTYRKS